MCQCFQTIWLVHCTLPVSNICLKITLGRKSYMFTGSCKLFYATTQPYLHTLPRSSIYLKINLWRRGFMTTGLFLLLYTSYWPFLGTELHARHLFDDNFEYFICLEFLVMWWVWHTHTSSLINFDTSFGKNVFRFCNKP